MDLDALFIRFNELAKRVDDHILDIEAAVKSNRDDLHALGSRLSEKVDAGTAASMVEAQKEQTFERLHKEIDDMKRENVDLRDRIANLETSRSEPPETVSKPPEDQADDHHDDDCA